LKENGEELHHYGEKDICVVLGGFGCDNLKAEGPRGARKIWTKANMEKGKEVFGCGGKFDKVKVERRSADEWTEERKK